MEIVGFVVGQDHSWVKYVRSCLQIPGSRTSEQLLTFRLHKSYLSFTMTKQQFLVNTQFSVVTLTT